MLRKIGYAIISYAPDGPAGGGAGETPSSNGPSSSSSSSPTPASSSTASPSGAASDGGTVTSGVPARPQMGHDDVGPAVGTEPDVLSSDLYNTIFGGPGEATAPTSEPVVTAPPSPTAPVVAPAPAQTPPAAAQPQAPGATPAPTSQQPPSGQPGPTQPSPPLTAADLVQLADGMEANEGVLVTEMAKTYAFSQEELEALGVDPSAAPALQAMMAKVQVRTTRNLMRFMNESLPLIYQRLSARDRAVNENRELFFSRNPDIPREHTAQILQWAAIYRQMNPTMTRDDMIRDIGEMAMRRFNIQPRAAAAPPTANGSHGQPRVAPQGAKPVAVFQPASPGAGGAPQPPEDPGANWQWLSPDFPTG